MVPRSQMFRQKPQRGTRHVAWHIAQEGLAAPGMVDCALANLVRSAVVSSPKSGQLENVVYNFLCAMR